MPKFGFPNEFCGNPWLPHVKTDSKIMAITTEMLVKVLENALKIVRFVNTSKDGSLMILVDALFMIKLMHAWRS